ncbi:hypothetical protein [Microbacterium sp.]|uniref:hypothetical protein n=1 Tax=Microbacterium sp. TaxID=51671 RepID=UPI002BCB0E0B|nr:hypothetical protein [Microbacterium sp.]HWL78110.1 hypothetical protein [Microbacterium sp.]
MSVFTTDSVAVGDVTIRLAVRDFHLAAVAHRFDKSDFQAGRGNTVYLTRGGALVAHGRKLDDVTNAIISENINELREPISLDVHAYSSVLLSEADLSLNITDLAKQVLNPQAAAVTAKIESALADVIDGLTVDDTIVYDPQKPVGVFTKARAAMRAKGVDIAQEPLVALVGTTAYDALLDSGALDAPALGGDPSALTKGAIGKIRGFDVVESSAIGDTEIVFLTRDNSLYLASRAPEVPAGVAGAVSNFEGFELRTLQDYDAAYTAQRSVVSTMVGVGILPAYKVTRTEDAKRQGEADYTPGTAQIEEIDEGLTVKADIENVDSGDA